MNGPLRRLQYRSTPLLLWQRFRLLEESNGVFLKTQVEMWIIIQIRFTLPTDNFGEQLGCDKWIASVKKQIEVDVKTTQILQCGLFKEELNWVDPFYGFKSRAMSGGIDEIYRSIRHRYEQYQRLRWPRGPSVGLRRPHGPSVGLR